MMATLESRDAMGRLTGAARNGANETQKSARIQAAEGRETEQQKWNK